MRGRRVAVRPVVRLVTALLAAWALALVPGAPDSRGAGPRPAAAQAAPGAAGFDLLFLVDQSGSMGGVASGTPASVVPIPNDPAGLRFVAPEAAIRILGHDRLGVRRNADYRVGLLSFGSGVET